MTVEERNNIFAKECLTISDIMLLLSLSYDAAARLIRDIKRKSDRLHIRGRVHTQDYLDYFGLTTCRYPTVPAEAQPTVKAPEPPKAPTIERRAAVEVLRSKDYIVTATRQSSLPRGRKIYKGGMRRNAR